MINDPRKTVVPVIIIIDVTRCRGEVVHEARGEQPLRRVSGAAREARGGRSVLGALPPALGALPPHAAPPGGAAAAYLSAARYVTGSRIDTSLFRPLPLRAHRGNIIGNFIPYDVA